MGVYSNNRTQLGAFNGEEIVANESYTSQTGLLEMMIDNVKNDQAIFEAVIGKDFQEAAGVVNESGEEVVQEATGFSEKVKEFLKKSWEKIKGIFKSFLAKIGSVVMRDNKEFVNKYKKEVLAKDLSKMKYKWAEPKAAQEGDSSVDDLNKKVASEYGKVIMSADAGVEEEINNGEFLEKCLTAALGSSTTVGEFAKDYHESCFEDVEEEEGLNTKRLGTIMDILTNSSTALKAIEKYQKDVDKMYSEMLKKVDKARNELIKDIPGKGNTEMLKKQNLGYKVVQTMQTGTQKLLGAQMEVCKYHIKQCRRVFAQAASFNPKAVKENALLIEAVGEAAEFEMTSTFADYSL